MAEHLSPPTDSDNSNGDAANHSIKTNGVTNGAANGIADGVANGIVPRVLPPEGARSARTYEGAPLETAPTEVETLDQTTQAETPDEMDDADADSSPFGTDYRADLRDSFLDALPPKNGVVAVEWQDDEPSSALSIEKIEADVDDSNAPAMVWAAAESVGADSIEGEQLFASDGGDGGDGGEPPSDLALASGGAGKPDTPRDKEAGLFEHLVELRQRLLYATFGVIAMMCLTWRYSLELQDWFSAPILRVLNSNGIKKGILMVTGPTDTFTIYFQFSLISALLLSMPWVMFQVWRFIEPALTNSERRYTLILVPFSSLLFFLGVALGYALSPLFFQFFLQFQPANVAAQWNYQDSLMLMAKMLLIFGLSFQVPIVIIFGNKIGLLSRNLLIEYWRHAVVVIFIVVAILTPTWDPFTMTACAVPPCLLYLLSIWLVKWL